jgi:hypothetical protein
MTDTPACLACGRGADVVPLITLAYRGGSHWICPQHLPVLIHDPTRLVGQLPGAEDLQPADHHD